MSPSNWCSLLSEARTFLQKSRAPPIQGCSVTAIRPRVCLGPTKSVQASDVSSLKEGRHEVETLGVPGSIHVCIVAKRAINQALDFFQAQTCDPCCPPLAQKVLFSRLALCYIWCMQVPQIRPVLMCMPKDAMHMMCQHPPSVAHTLHVILHILAGKGAKRKKWPRSPIRSGGSRKARHVRLRVCFMAHSCWINTW